MKINSLEAEKTPEFQVLVVLKWYYSLAFLMNNIIRGDMSKLKTDQVLCA